MDAWKGQDDARPRSKQAGLGMSSLGGCARQAYHELRGDAPTNQTKRLGSLLGTVFHGAVEELGLPGDTELEVRLDSGLTGHVDRYHDEIVRDWKFPKKSTIAWAKKNGPSQQYRWQVQTYAYALWLEGYKVREVWIVFIPRDGDEDDCWVYEESFDPSVAEEALQWLADVQHAAQAGVQPEPERHINFCRGYCPFYGLCPGGDNATSSAPEVDDPWLEAAADALWRAGEDGKAAVALKEQAAGALEGITGRFGKYLVTQRNTRYGTSYPYVQKVVD